MSVKKTKKRSLREMIALDKAQMLPLNFAFTYIIIPVYIAAALILLIVIGALSESTNTTAFLLCLVLLAVLTAAFLGMFPLVRKKAIASELKRYDLKRCRRKCDAMESQDEWDFSEKELSVRFNRYGMVLDGELCYYNHLTKLVYTGNDYHRVGIYICFSRSAENNILLPLNPKVLKMLDDFQIVLDNQPVFDYIFAHPQEAFTDIYDKGKVILRDEEQSEEK